MSTHLSTSPPDAAKSNSTLITRRALLGGTALAILGLSANNEAMAETLVTPDEQAFHRLSVALTGHDDLSPVTSKRMFEVLRRDDEPGQQRLFALVTLADAMQTPASLKAAASAAGLEAEFMRLLTAWYTGTIETPNGPVVLSYQEALMYRPVADGMTVPTYCNKGPMWWTGLPPQINRMPINNPRVL
ncbi:sugar dehydrogenase complex small subunit [Neorhizobium sp. JUb45]|uniref:sugar dehydrogenase complex small subunit n=1 Tax=Neorhizobium sp. JUb45 TaxID=2485113 RepID=UPI00104D7526|nr:sugar dehydrogenase complex small subunit [Neorhizobium sp. JUb45]TCQ97306.1 D-sorbitol dehydrogenase-like protein [Neorhizobium sp. JUb45]